MAVIGELGLDGSVRSVRGVLPMLLAAVPDVGGQAGAPGKWKSLILWELHHYGTRRFAELRRGLPGVSEKMLTQHLPRDGRRRARAS